MHLGCLFSFASSLNDIPKYPEWLLKLEITSIKVYLLKQYPDIETENKKNPQIRKNKEMKGHAFALHSTSLHASLSWFHNSKSAATTSPVHQLTSKSIFVTSQQSCSLQFSALSTSFTSHLGQDTTENL